MKYCIYLYSSLHPLSFPYFLLSAFAVRRGLQNGVRDRSRLPRYHLILSSALETPFSEAMDTGPPMHTPTVLAFHPVHQLITENSIRMTKLPTKSAGRSFCLSLSMFVFVCSLCVDSAVASDGVMASECLCVCLCAFVCDYVCIDVRDEGRREPWLVELLGLFTQLLCLCL